MRSIQRSRVAKPLAIVLFVLTVGGLAAPAKSAEPVDPATVQWAGDGVTFSIQSGSEFLLTVGGPGMDVQVQGRGQLSIAALDEDGQPLPDGLYRYELREIVTNPAVEEWEKVTDPEESEALRRRLVKEGLWPAPPRIQHDVFRIESGRIVAPPERTRVEENEASSDAEPHDHPHAN